MAGRLLTNTISVVALLLVSTAVAAAAAKKLDDAALRAYANRPWDKAALMNTTVRLGRHHGAMVVAEFPCGDVCPQYTLRIIHYQLPAGIDCQSIGGVERSVGIPMAIALLPKRFCFPKVLVETGQFYSH